MVSFLLLISRYLSESSKFETNSLTLHDLPNWSFSLALSAFNYFSNTKLPTGFILEGYKNKNIFIFIENYRVFDK